MLVLSRRGNQSIVIGDRDQIRVTVLAIRRREVKLGIDAPRHLTVRRRPADQASGLVH